VHFPQAKDHRKRAGTQLATLVVVRVIYVNNIASSIAVPAIFEGDLAAISAADYVKRLMVVPRNEDIANRTEYMVLPAGESAKLTKEENTGVHARPTVFARKLGS
jgi:hypothetical protein